MAARIPTTKPTILGTELALIKEALTLSNLNGKGKYTRLCEQWLETFMPTDSKGKAFVLSSCTSALELAAILANIQPGDEIIVPSYTYVSTVNSFVLRGAVPVFVSLDSRTMNIDARVIEAAITSKTRVLVPVHYGGIAADMDPIMDIARRYGLLVVEDAAMACTSLYKGRMLGTIGHIGCISFQEKKNFTAGGQGGALLVNDPSFIDRARIVYEHGTNRGQVDRYQWLDLGINATLSEVQAAFLYAQLQAADTINASRLKLWQRYHSALRPLVEKGYLILPTIPGNTTHNGNVFWIRLVDARRRRQMIEFLNLRGIQAHPQFMPLHSSPMGLVTGRFSGDGQSTEMVVAQILLLPLFVGLSDGEQERVIEGVFAFWTEIRPS
ncbi:putative pyridoxal phosphate-dependent enzyme [Aspergillus uvarum CBS 121591]|uniref:Putative pyridoxal phosphate-dependent enzyme n=1 Tax=Aspergillus uvarum CBS 121591 TaxID=1448315 RepID=A0A319C3Z6_9EURO|nr:putative pyridoxal phosphate-dependent enzyme [Aspergillus uvarum CBS 121591]PYH78579.1 putative pyridoxal phosphate-dependent enzyme [Aspergillus uvarum CBS 121591]